jgi:hypothetical protein
MKFKIKNTEIIDNSCKNQETGLYQPSEISILVELEMDEKGFYLDFQTTNTQDYGAFSSSLAAYDGTDAYLELEDHCSENEIDFDELLKKVKKESSAQNLWIEYINENYVKNENHYGGSDANSEINEMSKIDD